MSLGSIAVSAANAATQQPLMLAPPSLRPAPISSLAVGRVRPLALRLPTDNRALLDGQPKSFFMGVDRTVDGQALLVWEGGQYGFVRNPFLLNGETVYTRFHEGIDIAPALRDNQGEPLDLVCAISDGRVVFTSAQQRSSNYGNYVVIEHDWGYGPFYSLYGHLMRMDVQPAEIVKRGHVLGRLGYTGSGIDRRRAHVHLELNILLNERFEQWHARLDPLQPAQTPFHGFNLVGLDIAAIYKALAADPAITIPQFLASQPVYFRVIAPSPRGELEILRRYPWLCGIPRSTKSNLVCPSWEISFTASGLPLHFEPSEQHLPYPIVSSIVPFTGKHSWKTMGRVGGTDTAATLTPKGTEYVNLVMGAF
ncbi:MAG: M23 family metallopeptidase [Verrucomicrobiales bacterium]